MILPNSPVKRIHECTKCGIITVKFWNAHYDRTYTREEWTKIFQAVDACVTPVLSMGESPKHSHANARETFFTTSGILQPKPPPIFSETISEPSPTSEVPGQSTTEILKKIGMDDSKIERLRTSGVIG